MTAESATARPHVFIASSSTALPLAHEIKRLLGEDVVADVWNEDLFQIGKNLLDELLLFARLYDFAIAVLHADDRTICGDASYDAPRDNVLFELGLFMGAVDRERALVVEAPATAAGLKLPSDVHGNTGLRLDPARLWADPARTTFEPTYLADRVAVMRRMILERFEASPLLLLPSTGLAMGYFHNFLVPVCTYLQRARGVSVAGLDIEGGNYDFDICIPTSLSGFSVAAQRDFVYDQQLRSFAVPNEGEGRPYPFFHREAPHEGRVQFCDYPTTLRASADAIGMIIGSRALGQDSRRRELLGRKESQNFKKTLDTLLRDLDRLCARVQTKHIDVPPTRGARPPAREVPPGSARRA